MAYSASRIGKFTFVQETTFATDPLSKTYIPLIEKPSLDGAGKAHFPKDQMKQGLYTEPGIVGHESESTLSISYYMHGWSSSTPSVGPDGLHPDAELLAMAFGNYYEFGAGGANKTAGGATSFVTATGIATGVDADSKTNDIITVAEGDSSSYTVGEAVMVQTTDNTTEKWEVGIIKKFNIAAAEPDEIVLESGLENSTLGSSTDLVAGTTVLMTDDFNLSSISVDVESKDANDSANLTGGRPTSCKISATPREFAKVDMEFLFNTFTRDTSGAPAYTTYSPAAREQIVGGILRLEEWDDTDVSVVHSLDCASFEFDLGLETTQPVDPTNAQGAGDPVKTNQEPKISFNPLYQDETLKTAYNDGTCFNLIFKWGSGPGNTIAIFSSKTELSKEPVVGDRDNLQAYAMELTPVAYDSDTGTGEETNPINKDLRIAFL